MARPTEFNRIEVLERAMAVFWERGYASTSMADLVDAMDLKPGSIYCAFSSKQALLVEAVNHYAATQRGWLLDLLKSSSSVRCGFEEAFKQMIEGHIFGESVNGCLIINMLLELASINDEVAELTRGHLNATKLIFRGLLEKSQIANELAIDGDPETSATFLIGTVYAIRVMSLASAPKEEMDAYVKHALDSVFKKAQSG